MVFLAASASAEFLADIALCPLEAIKVRMQTTNPPFARNLREGWSKVVAQEGIGGLYKGLYPLWARQIPYTMVKFATFEATVSQIYSFLGKPKESYSGLQQTGVSFLGGYIAGVGCAVVSHPAGTFIYTCSPHSQVPILTSCQTSWYPSSTATAKPARAQAKPSLGSTAISASAACGTACPRVSS